MNNTLAIGAFLGILAIFAAIVIGIVWAIAHYLM